MLANAPGRKIHILSQNLCDPLFVRLLADHLASMTDGFALAEHARLLEMGAIPIPSFEQLRREEDPES